MQHRLLQQIFPHLYQIYTLSDQQNQDNCLYGFSDLTPENSEHRLYEYYEDLFQKIDQDNWEVFKGKLSEKVLGTRSVAKISITEKAISESTTLYIKNFKVLIILMRCMAISILRTECIARKLRFFKKLKIKHPT